MIKCRIPGCQCPCHIPIPSCPSCGSKDVYRIGFAQYDKMMKHWKCKKCNKTWYKRVAPHSPAKRDKKAKKKKVKPASIFKSVSTFPK